MPEPTKGLEGISLAGVEETVQGAGAEVVLPSLRRVDLVSALRVGKCAETASLQLLGEGTKLNLKVLDGTKSIGVHPGERKDKQTLALP